MYFRNLKALDDAEHTRSGTGSQKISLDKSCSQYKVEGGAAGKGILKPTCTFTVHLGPLAEISIYNVECVRLSLVGLSTFSVPEMASQWFSSHNILSWIQQ